MTIAPYLSKYDYPEASKLIERHFSDVDREAVIVSLGRRASANQQMKHHPPSRLQLIGDDAVTQEFAAALRNQNQSNVDAKPIVTSVSLHSGDRFRTLASIAAGHHWDPVTARSIATSIQHICALYP